MTTNRALAPARVVTMTSRRGAGVWSHLPSLTASLLQRRAAPTTAVWIDLGLRYEMLNHLGIPSSNVPAGASLTGLMKRRDAGDDPGRGDLLELTAVTLGDGRGGAPLVRLLGANPDEYRSAVQSFREAGHRIFMVPFQVPGFAAPDSESPDHAARCERTIERVVSLCQPDFVFLTCEGQPESNLFGALLARSILLQWALNVADLIFCLVRHDSAQRFHDSVSIPSLLSRNPDWRDQIRIGLTRTSSDVAVPDSLRKIVLGHLPFSELVGHAVSLGRIPIFDTAAGQGSGTAGEVYSRALKDLAERLVGDLQ